MDNSGEQISDLEDRIMWISLSEQQRERQMGRKKEINILDLWDNINKSNLCILWIPEEK